MIVDCKNALLLTIGYRRYKVGFQVDMSANYSLSINLCYTT